MAAPPDAPPRRLDSVARCPVSVSFSWPAESRTQDGARHACITMTAQHYEKRRMPLTGRELRLVMGTSEHRA